MFHQLHPIARLRLSIFSLLLICASLIGCGPKDPTSPASDHIDVLVHVTGLHSEISTLRVNARLNGKQAQEPLELVTRMDPFIVELAADATGELSLDAIALDPSGCRVATGQTQITVVYTPPFQIEATLPLTSLLAPSCTLSMTKSGPADLVSDPRGLICESNSTLCSGEFPKGTRITLRNKNVKAHYVSWSGACTGNGACSFDHDGARALSAYTFPRECSRNFCAYNGLPGANSIQAFWGSSADDLWAATRGNALWHYDGKSWKVAHRIAESAYFLSIWGSGPKDIWASAYPDWLLHYDGTTWTRVTTTAYYYNMWGFGPQDVWAVSENGAIFHYDGISWTQEASGTGKQLRGVFGSSRDDVWAVGIDGTILRRQLGTWTPHPQSGLITTAHLHGIWGSASNDIWVIGPLIRLHWDGTTWSQTPTSANTYTIWGSGPRDIWTAGSEYTLQHFDGGLWRTINLGPGSLYSQQIFTVFGTSASNVWIGGQGGSILHTSSAQGPFTWQTSVSIHDIKGLWGATPDDLWAVDGTGYLLRFDGQDWTRTDIGASRPLFRIFGISANDVYAIGPQIVMHYDGNGWTRLLDPVIALHEWFDIWGSGPDDIYIVGGSGKILHGSAAGFVVETGCGTGYLYAAFGTHRSDVWVAGSGVLCHSTGSGSFTQILPTPTTNTIYSLWGVATNSIWAVGEQGTILHYDGFDWSPHAQSGLVSQGRLYEVRGRATNDVWITGNNVTDGEVLHYDGSQWSQRVAAGFPPVARLWVRDKDDVWLAGGGGSILRYQP